MARRQCRECPADSHAACVVVAAEEVGVGLDALDRRGPALYGLIQVAILAVVLRTAPKQPLDVVDLTSKTHGKVQQAVRAHVHLDFGDKVVHKRLHAGVRMVCGRTCGVILLARMRVRVP